MLYGLVDQGLYAGIGSGINGDGGGGVAEGRDFLGYGVDG